MSYHAQPTIDVQSRMEAARRNSIVLSLLLALLCIGAVVFLLASVLIRPEVLRYDPISAYQGKALEVEPVKQNNPVSLSRLSRPAAAQENASIKMMASQMSSPIAVPTPEQLDVAYESLSLGQSDTFGSSWDGSEEDGSGGESGFIFGQLSGPGLKGTFYDLKQDRRGRRTKMRVQTFEKKGKVDPRAPVNRLYDQHLRTIVDRNANKQAFADYFESPKQLVLTQFYIPQVRAEKAPEAFELGGEVEGRRWMICYQGRIVAPEEGRYRFVGFSDDILVVLENDRVVLDGSIAPAFEGEKKRPSFKQEGTKKSWRSYQGKWMDVQKGEELDLTLITGERPGGYYGGYLLIEKEGEDYEVDSGGAPLLPLFKTESTRDPEQSKTLPPLAPETPWSVWRTKV